MFITETSLAVNRLGVLVSTLTVGPTSRYTRRGEIIRVSDLYEI